MEMSNSCNLNQNVDNLDSLRVQEDTPKCEEDAIRIIILSCNMNEFELLVIVFQPYPMQRRMYLHVA